MPQPPVPPFLPDWFPDQVLSVTAPIESRSNELHPAEAALIANAVAVRRDEFATCRAHARALLARLGCAPAPLLRRADDSPDWPVGVIGSITHTRGLCGVAVARPDGNVLGIDVEPGAELPDRNGAYVLTADEQRRHSAEPERCVRARLATIAFSLKEAVYKCLQPFRNSGLRFADVELVFADDWLAATIKPGPAVAERIPPGMLYKGI